MNNLSQVSNDAKFWAVTLDGRVIKTMYKDKLLLPTKALAEALAEEWASQPATLDIRKLYYNNMMAKAMRAKQDPALVINMQDEVQTTLENDQICFVEPAPNSILDDFKHNLREA